MTVFLTADDLKEEVIEERLTMLMHPRFITQNVISTYVQHLNFALIDFGMQQHVKLSLCTIYRSYMRVQGIEYFH